MKPAQFAAASCSLALVSAIVLRRIVAIGREFVVSIIRKVLVVGTLSPHLTDRTQLSSACDAFPSLCVPASPAPSPPPPSECLVSVKFLNGACFMGTSSKAWLHNFHALFSITTWVVFAGLLAD